MSIDANKALVERYIAEAWNRGNVALVGEIFEANYIGSGYGGVAGLQTAITSYRTSFPDLHFIIEDVVAEADKIAYRWTARGTHHGTYEDIAPTGKPMIVTGITMLRIVDGKIVEDHSQTTVPSINEQLEGP